MHLARLAEQSAAHLGEHLVLDFEGQRYTNFQLLDQGARFQTALAGLGLRRGSVAAVAMMNHPLIFPLFQGIFRNGATALPVMPQAAPPEMRYVLNDMQAEVVITDVDRLPTVREAVAGLDCVRNIVVQGGSSRTDGKVPEHVLEDLATSEPTKGPAVDDDSDVAVILFSSGTTGRPKGVELTHANLHSGAEAVTEAAELHSWEGPRTMLSAMPIAHIFGIAIMDDLYMIPKSMVGRSHLVQMRWFDPEGFMARLQQEHCTAIAAVPTLMAVILNHPATAKYDLSSLVEVVCGAAPLPVELAQAFMRRFDCRVREVYGLTEASGLGTANRRTEPYRPGSAGRAYCNTQLRIVDDADQPVAARTPGEICLRGPIIMKGYHNRPEDTALCMRGGWLHTGDIGYLDEDGHLFVVDRKKDMIIRGGENIYPAELEEILFQHPGVAEAAVVGTPDPIYGENVVAYVVPRKGAQLDEGQIIEHVAQNVARFKAPTRVHIIDVLPKSPIGKVLRRVLRERAAASAAAEAGAASDAAS
jgi:long-chain acyl-CoA synthetase